MECVSKKKIEQLQKEIQELKKREARMEWPIIFLVFLLYYLTYKWLGKTMSAYLFAWFQHEDSEIIKLVSEI